MHLNGFHLMERYIVGMFFQFVCVGTRWRTDLALVVTMDLSGHW